MTNRISTREAFMLLEGKTALVTGGGQGIGKVIALTLAAQGADVAVCDINQENLDATEQEIKALGREAMGVSADVTSYEQAVECVDKIVDRWGKIDILIANAGITKDMLMLKMAPADFEKVIQVNLTGTFNFVKAVYRPMMKQRSGRIIGIASVIGLMGNAGQANYAASKAGIIGLIKSVAKELAARGVTANAIAPGYIQTKMTDILSDDVKGKIMSTIPMNKLGQPQDVANAALFLSSDLAAYVTGQVITVDGGMVM